MTKDTLKDATSSTLKGAHGIEMSDVNRGYVSMEQDKTARYSNDDGADPVGDAFSFNPGFLGRPRGWAR